jgi:hypothetical protein
LLSIARSGEGVSRERIGNACKALYCCRTRKKESLELSE